MKVVRLKRGYRINLSDSEFAALKMLVSHGMADVSGFTEWDLDNLPPDERRGLSTFEMLGALDVTDDRRSS